MLSLVLIVFVVIIVVVNCTQFNKCVFTQAYANRDHLWRIRKKEIESGKLAPYPEFFLSQRVTGHGQRVNYNSDLQIGVRVRLREQVFFTDHAL